MLDQRFEPQGRCFTNFHNYYYSTRRNRTCIHKEYILVLIHSFIISVTQIQQYNSDYPKQAIVPFNIKPIDTYKPVVIRKGKQKRGTKLHEMFKSKYVIWFLRPVNLDLGENIQEQPPHRSTCII